MMRRSQGERLFEISNYTFLLLAAFMALYPVWHEVSLSFSAPEEAMRGGLFLLPRKFSLEAYSSILGSNYLFVSYKNSIFVTVIATSLSLLLTAVTAYPLTKQSLPGKNLIVFLILFTMLFNGGLIPSYLLIKSLGLVDTLWALVFPGAISAFNVFIMMNFFKTIPAEIEESAFIDGANPVKIFFAIIVPLSKPVIATVGLWEIVANWNSFMAALIYINSRGNYTLPLLLKEIIRGQDWMRETGEMLKSSTESVIGATIVMAMLPVLCAYPFLQKYFVKGVMIGSVKG